MDKQTVTKVARLARIRLTEEEKDGYTAELTKIFEWIEQLGEVNTDGVAQMTSVANVTLPMREDAITTGNIQEDILSNAPQSEYGCFAVPKVVE